MVAGSHRPGLPTNPAAAVRGPKLAPLGAFEHRRTSGLHHMQKTPTLDFENDRSGAPNDGAVPKVYDQAL
jgi:hypothetical protein